MKKRFTEREARKELERGKGKAIRILNDEDKAERFLQRLEKKLRSVPVAGNTLAAVPVLLSLFRSFVKREYRDIPIGSLVAITSALVYFLSPIDIIPDVLPGIGLVDDALVVTTCLKLVQSDVDEYLAWRKEHGKELLA